MKKNKSHERREKTVFGYSRKESISLLLIFALFLVLSFFVPEKTGRVSDTIDVAIKDRTAIEVLLDYQPMITIYDTQNISVEAVNIGTQDYDVRIHEYIYNLSNITLNLTASYVDSSAYLYPGGRRAHKIIFVPPGEGTYFIKASVNYGQRLSEVWGSFRVVTEIPEVPPNATNQTPNTTTNGTTPAGGGGGGGNIPQVRPLINRFNTIIAPQLTLEYPNNITTYVNHTALLSVKVTNIGNYSADQLKFFMSTPDVIETDVNPKATQVINPNESLTFLVAIKPKSGIMGNFTLDFEIVSRYVKVKGTTLLSIVDLPPSPRNYLWNLIVNYEYLISEIDTEIEIAAIRGHDVSVPRALMETAKKELGLAREYFESQEYDMTQTHLSYTEKNLMQAVFALGNLQLPVIVEAEFSYIWIILLIAFFAFLFFLAYRRRKKRMRRPKLLEKSSEE